MKKLRLAQSMMWATILLIFAFQAYWLVKLYKDEREDLKKETDVIFRETVYRLQVARFKKDTIAFKGFSGPKVDDNLFNIEAINVLRKQIDTTRAGKIILSVDHDNSKGQAFQLEELKMDTGLKEAGNMRQINIMTDKNGINAVKILPILPKLNDSMSVNKLDHTTKDRLKKDKHDLTHKSDATPKMVWSRILTNSKSFNDSIPLKQLDSAYEKDLKKSAIYLPFIISKSADKKSLLLTAKNNFKTNAASVGFLSPYYYQASFQNPFYYLLRRIAPQIILSVLLIAFTTSSFIVLYRNLIAQRRLADIKNEFISNITHELKTPIATVNVAIEAMKNFNALNNPERTKEYLDISALELQRLSLLVDKVLKLSMFENKAVELKKEWFDIEELLKEIIASMKLQFEKQKAHITLQKSGDNFTINADKMHITSVIYNLLDNALKYSKQQAQIVVHLISHTNYFEMQITDNGMGIPPEYKTKIFDKFFRVPSGDRHNIKGYGLGLSYVIHILKRHFGFIEVESEVGKGSTFIVKLPYEEAPVINYDNNRRITKRRTL